MGRPKGGVNEKVQKANEKKAVNKAVKDARSAAEAERQLAEEWKNGANNRSAARAANEAMKEEEARRRREEKAALIAAEEAEMSNTSKAKKAVGSGQKAKSSKKKKGKKDDLSLLEDALISSADKKVKRSSAEKRRKEREAEEARKAKEEERERNNEQLDPLMANTNAMIGDLDEGESMVGRERNKALENNESGLNAAINSLSVSGKPDTHPEKRMKAAYIAYQERMLPVFKQDYPGLKLSQYKEKIFTMWKKAPENPMNQQV